MEEEEPMDSQDIPYLLKRACAHRAMALVAKSIEARCIHHQFVKRYQHLLAGIRHAQLPVIHSVPERQAA